MSLLRLIAVLALVVGMPASGAAQSAPPYRLTVAGASPGGLWQQLGAGIDRAVASAYPGSTVSYQTTGGGLANIPLVSLGQVPMGIALDTEADIALKGEDPYRDPIRDTRMLVRLYSWQINYMLLAREFADRHAIATLADIVAKKPPIRIVMNRRGNATGKISAAILEAAGITPQAVESWGGQIMFAASGEQTNLAVDRRIDMIANGLFVPDDAILQATGSVRMIWLDTPRPVAEKVARDTAGQVTVVKAGAYPWMDKDVVTTAHGAVLLVSERMDEATAYGLTRALVRNVEKVRGDSKAMAALTGQVMAEPSVVAFHPGALRYLREAGLTR